MNSNSKIIFWFLSAAVWTALIFLTLPYAPDMTGWMTSTINKTFETDYGYKMLGHISAVILGIILLILFYKLISNPITRKPLRLILIIAVAGVYGYLVSIMEVPTEKIHFLEYGFLSYLLYKGWSSAIISKAVFPNSLFTGVAIGTLDETIQHILPNRHGELIDIFWNIIAVGLPLVIFRLFEKTERSSSDRRAISTRVAGIFAFLLLLGFTVLIQEYGIEVRDPRGYIFKTRTNSPEKLFAKVTISEDAIRRIRMPSLFDYDTFLRDFPAEKYPKLNEFRVHLFRRDRYIAYTYHDLIRLSISDSSFMPLISNMNREKLFQRALNDYILYYGKDDAVNLYGAESLQRAEFWLAGKDTDWGKPLTDSYYLQHRKKSSAGDSPKRDEWKKNLFVALKENFILEDYFGELLDATESRWNQDSVERIYSLTSPHENYNSAVGERIVTGCSKTEVILFFSLLILMILVYPRIFEEVRINSIAILVCVIFYIAFIHPDTFHRVKIPTEKIISGNHSVITISYLRSEPRIDGVPDIDLKYSMVYANGGTGAPPVPGNNTHFGIGYTENFLYFAAECQDTSIASSIFERDSDLWREDAVELFLDTESLGRRYAEFEINPNATLYDAIVEYGSHIDFENSKRWNCDGLTAAAHRGAKSWSIELKIPLKQLGINADFLKKGIRMNVMRIDGAPKEGFFFYAWSPTYGWFHRPWRFGFCYAG